LPLIRAELQRRRLPRPGPLLHDLSQVLYLPFDHDDGSYARDRSGYNNHGTIYGATRVAGKVADGLSFDGVDDYVEVTHDNSITFTSEDFSIDLWFKRRRTGTLEFLVLKGKYETDGWRVFIHSDDRVYFETNQFGALQRTISSTTTKDVWYYLAIVRKGADATIYLDGRDATVIHATHVDPDLNTKSLLVGIGEDKFSSPFDGDIDELRVYNRALSAAEIPRLMYLRGI